MRDIVVSTVVTLDGVRQAPAGPEEDERGGWAYFNVGRLRSTSE